MELMGKESISKEIQNKEEQEGKEIMYMPAKRR
jgi:hypothetical protein